MPRGVFHLTSAGSVDDGKSTILARFLLDTGSVYEDHLGGIDPSKVTATTIADLLDGLESERDQGITIDVAHRFFDSPHRRYQLADSPGHEEYTRNMATAASHADALMLVLDAQSGVKPQTLTHLRIAYLLGVRQVIVAVNKMDLVGHQQKVFRDREAEIGHLLQVFDGIDATIIPVSGLTGAHIVNRSRTMRWWEGPTLLESLDALEPSRSKVEGTVVSIQDIQRISGGGRRYLASVFSGSIRPGIELTLSRSGSTAVLDELFESGKESKQSSAPAEVSFRTRTDNDLERGDVLTSGSVVEVMDQFQANLVWLSDRPGLLGRTFELRLGHQTARASMTRLWQLGLGTGERGGEVQMLGPNDLGVVNIDVSTRVVACPFEELPELGRFILIDSMDGSTVAAGMVTHSLRGDDTLIPHSFAVGVAEREQLTGTRGQVVWFTGLSGSGKSTLADRLSSRLAIEGIPHSVLDGDSLRKGLNRDLGFGEADRVENIRRTAEVARLMADSGLVVLVSLISPYRADRDNARAIIGPERFTEVWVDTPIEVCELRDPKGLYKRARAGLISNFTGIDDPYEEPEHPDIVIDGQQQVTDSLDHIMRYLQFLPAQRNRLGLGSGPH